MNLGTMRFNYMAKYYQVSHDYEAACCIIYLGKHTEIQVKKECTQRKS